jgi:hypothetical protein
LIDLMFRPRSTAIDDTASNMKSENLSRTPPVLVDSAPEQISAQRPHPPFPEFPIEIIGGSEDETPTPAVVKNELEAGDRIQNSCSGMEETKMEEPGTEKHEQSC